MEAILGKLCLINNTLRILKHQNDKGGTLNFNAMSNNQIQRRELIRTIRQNITHDRCDRRICHSKYYIIWYLRIKPVFVPDIHLKELFPLFFPYWSENFWSKHFFRHVEHFMSQQKSWNSLHVPERFLWAICIPCILNKARYT